MPVHCATAYRGVRDGRAGWYLRLGGGSPDEFDLTLERLKQIPAADRSYDPERHLWWFDLACEGRVGDIVYGFAAFAAQPALPGLGEGG